VDGQSGQAVSLGSDESATMSAHPKRSAEQVVVNPPAASLGMRNAILWGQGKQYRVADFAGPLSIKTVLRGSARWATSEADRLVDEGSYLVLNSGQTYTITIDARETVETFCLFFRRGLAEDIFQTAASRPESLLDDPFRETARSVEFFETLRTHDALVSPLVRRIHTRLKEKTASGPWLEDQFLAVASALCKVHGEAEKHAALIPAKKYSTRIELYRRLLRGKDYMDSFFAGPLGLEQVAAEACLSSYHFHRLFREVFRETPNQYLQRKRLAEAKRLLERGYPSVTDVCLAVGFESITSFSGLFRRNFGYSPREYRSLKAARPRP
jgi:AraC family transcriptional regulator